MNDNLLSDVAIIGAGLGGCALALALSKHDIPFRIYEARHPEHEVIKSGVVLTPNGLWVLDKLGVFDRIKDRCYTTTHRVFKNGKDETTRKSLISNDSLYGYSNHRVWRKLLLEEMRKMLAERSVQIRYGSKFNGIVSDAHEGVIFRINEVAYTASLLIGSDGIYSSVRQYLAPGIKAEYTGIVGVLSHIKRASVDWPYEDYERNATIQDKPGAMFFIPEDPEAVDIMIGMQVQYPEQSRDDLERLQADRDKLAEFYRKDHSEWGRTARSIIDEVTKNKETLYIWPFLRMPKLPRWYSDTGRVILVGDGAHALPPSSGQGVNQALEDMYSLSLLLTSDERQSSDANGIAGNDANPSDAKLLNSLSRWQEMRQTKIDAIYDWATNTTNVSRMSEADRNKLIAEGKIKKSQAAGTDDMRWLYKPNLEEDMQRWVFGPNMKSG